MGKVFPVRTKFRRELAVLDMHRHVARSNARAQRDARERKEYEALRDEFAAAMVAILAWEKVEREYGVRKTARKG